MARQVLDEWFTTANPFALLNLVHPPATPPHTPRPPSRATVRRMQLFSVACARMVWNLLATDARNAVLVRERFADGRATEADLRAVGFRQPSHAVTAQHYAAATAAWVAGVAETRTAVPVNNADEAARSAVKALAAGAAGPAPPGSPTTAAWETAWNAAYAAARAHQAELVRDIFPPPGYTPALNPDWRTSTVVALARQMDETGDFSAVPILADALQDAGCNDDLMLDRCRSPSGVHSRGNWVVDLVLGRE